MSRLNVVGFDPSLRNWGIACGTYDTDSGIVSIAHLDVIQPVLPTGKQVRVNSVDLASAVQLALGAARVIDGAHAIFVEVPVGSQSARAMASYGICVGVLGGLRAQGIPFYEVTPTEVKMIAAGKRTASKQDMIQWAMDKHQEAPWPRYQSKGHIKVSEATAEHMADAVAAIHAGIASNPFRQALPFIRAA